jgi:hypothetical protein
MVNVFVFSTCIISLSSCLGPKKIDKWIAKKYDNTLPQTKKKNDYVTVNANVPYPGGNSISITESKTTNMLPLLFYWHWHYKNITTLNPQIGITTFANTVNNYANKSLKQKLNGKKIELTVDSIPTNFVIDDNAHMIWLIYAYGWDYISILPLNKQMAVSYKIINTDNTVFKTGSVTIPNIGKGVPLQMFQSLKKKTGEFLDEYESNIAVMSKTIVDKISEEL